MRRPAGLSLVQRALIERDWRAEVITAHIHALIGDDSDRLVNGAGRVLYVVLGAAITEGADPELPDLRIVRGAVNAVHDQAGEAEIHPMRRSSIESGLLAAERLIPAFERRSLINAACELELKLRAGHVNTSDFEALVAKFAPTESIAITERRA